MSDRIAALGRVSAWIERQIVIYEDGTQVGRANVVASLPPDAPAGSQPLLQSVDVIESAPYASFDNISDEQWLQWCIHGTAFDKPT